MANQRHLPYEIKPPPDWEEKVKDMQETPLYLIHTTGPTCYSVRGEDSNRAYKVYIGDRQMCSCGGGKDTKKPDLCKHILFVMVKVLRVPPTNPLSWQRSLVDSEVSQVLQGRFSIMESRTGQKHTFLKRRGAHLKPWQAEGGGDAPGAIERRALDPEEVCPICQDEMTRDQALTYCKRSCGNNIHVKCMKMYTEFQKASSSTKVVCPLCRVDWPGGAVHAEPWGNEEEDDLAKGMRRRQRRRSCPPWKFQSRCEGCSRVIQALACPVFYRCIHCPHHCSDLCRSCFTTRGGLPPCPSHPHCYVQGDLKAQACTWKSAGGGAASSSSSVLLPADVIRSLEGRELGAGDYDLFLRLDEQVRQQHSLPHFLVDRGLPDADPPATDGGGVDEAGGHDRVGDRAMTTTGCALCKEALTAQRSLKALPCGHAVHTSCALSQFLEAAEFGDEGASWPICPTCTSPIFPNLRLRWVTRCDK